MTSYVSGTGPCRTRFVVALGALSFAMAFRPTTLSAQHNSCNGRLGTFTVETGRIKATCDCPWFEVSGGHGSLGGSYGLGQNGVASLTLLFPARSGTFTCSTKAVLIEYVAGEVMWTAYHYRGWTFGECTLRNEVADSHHWRGHLTGRLVIVDGDRATGSPRYLHTRKEQSGRPLTMTIDLYGELAKPGTVGGKNP